VRNISSTALFALIDRWMFLLPDSTCQVCGILILNVGYNIPSPSAGISFLKSVASRTETGNNKEKIGLREPRKLLIH
jgi:hypothetical protein